MELSKNDWVQHHWFWDERWTQMLHEECLWASKYHLGPRRLFDSALDIMVNIIMTQILVQKLKSKFLTFSSFHWDTLSACLYWLIVIERTRIWNNIMPFWETFHWTKNNQCGKSPLSCVGHPNTPVPCTPVLDPPTRWGKSSFRLLMDPLSLQTSAKINKLHCKLRACWTDNCVGVLNLIFCGSFIEW